MRIIKYWIALIMMTGLLPSSAWAFSLAELEKQIQAIPQIEGQFVQARYLKSLSKPILSEGRFVLSLQKGLLWYLEKPFEDALRVTAQGVAQKENGQWVVSDTALVQRKQMELFLNLLEGKMEKLSQYFELSLSGEPKAWTLSAVPNHLVSEQIFNRIEIFGSKYVEKIIFNEKQGDKVDIFFNQVMDKPILNDEDKNAFLP